MAKGFNKVIVSGYLSRDAEVRATNTGKTVGSFSVAVNGYKEGDVFWGNVVVWGPMIDNIGTYLTKGTYVIVEGRLQTRKYIGTDGVERTTTEIVAQDITFGPKSQNSETRELVAAGGGSGDFVDEEDLPF